MPPRWSHSNKDGIGTAYSADSRIWFTVWRGILTEVYYPTVDRPQLRDLEFLLTDDTGLFHEEKRDLPSHTERLGEHALGYRTTSEDPEGRYRLRKVVIADPHLPCVLERVRLEVLAPARVPGLRLHVLAAPHLDGGGARNSASVQEVLDRHVLVAEKGPSAIAVSADRPFRRCSVGYVGASDGWTDLSAHRQLTWEFDRAPDGNVALVGEVPLTGPEEFTLGIAFGENVASAITTLFQSLGTPFAQHQRRFVAQWRRTGTTAGAPERKMRGPSKLEEVSRSILLAHEDKTYPGAFIASLSIPWGATRGDEDAGGYHLVWVRDLFHAATGLLAAGEVDPPLRALIYLATRQQPDGGFPQNFWLDGRPYWRGVQLDEVAFPILLAGRLERLGALEGFDPTPMVLRAARFLVLNGPATQQDRWEELGGYSPSSLATVIAALAVASGFARRVGEERTSKFLLEHADFLEAHIEPWTVTEGSALVPGVLRHYVRIRPVPVDLATPDEGPEMGRVRLPNLDPAGPSEFDAREIVDAGFLDLVRLGLRPAEDPLIVDSLRVVDALLKVPTPYGPAWRRYNHDGYGERPDGSAFQEWGVGRAWPLLAGERGHYELARGEDPSPYLRAMEGFATSTGLLPEQVWDETDRPSLYLKTGRPTESATPLAWAHAEYIKLARSARDGAVFDRVPEAADRYLGTGRVRETREVWKFNRRPSAVPAEANLRIVADRAFRLHFSSDGWSSASDQPAEAAGLGMFYVDLPPLGTRGRSWVFTFYWPEREAWEGVDYRVDAAGPLHSVAPPTSPPAPHPTSKDP